MRLLALVATSLSLLSSRTLAGSNITADKSSQQILTGDFKPPPVFEHTNLVRNTNLEKGYVRETINVVVTNVDSKPQQEYYLPFDYNVMGKVGGIEVKDKKNVDQGKLKVEALALTARLNTDGSPVK